MRTLCGNAVAFQPNGFDFFLADLVVKHIDRREDGKGLFNSHLSLDRNLDWGFEFSAMAISIENLCFR